MGHDSIPGIIRELILAVLIALQRPQAARIVIVRVGQRDRRGANGGLCAAGDLIVPIREATLRGIASVQFKIFRPDK